jgi:hypothetical protein
MSKKLFVLVNDCGDGSYHPQYTMNEEWILRIEGNLDRYYGVGCDGDGFHYSVLTVPDECTLESLGIKFDCAEADLDV